ncbi:hypothetical protein CH063_13533 [Colletotrichum higginsianum]|uniref:Uncharacterized protein n=1 Tax=Colletotrichum higginsianum (strain IMI 349063) TaxID=759273 RepID=H1VUS8_COLHI|nr:hypothetical protein CH063_13533 [Colletotrichum higginsianum]
MVAGRKGARDRRRAAVDFIVISASLDGGLSERNEWAFIEGQFHEMWRFNVMLVERLPCEPFVARRLGVGYVRSVNGGLVLSATALMTGCQAPNNWDRADLTKEESVYSKRRFYRALLEKVFFDKGIRLDTESRRPVWGARKGDTASFVQFARRAVGVLGVDGSGIHDDELASYESRYRDYSSRIAILWMLSVLCCKAVESVIALDRWWFLVENGGHNVDVLPVFDYNASPRNLMIVASRDIS